MKMKKLLKKLGRIIILSGLLLMVITVINEMTRSARPNCVTNHVTDCDF